MGFIDLLVKLFAPPSSNNNTVKQEDMDKIQSQINDLKEEMNRINTLIYNTAGETGTLKNRFEKHLEELADTATDRISAG